MRDLGIESLEYLVHSKPPRRIRVPTGLDELPEMLVLRAQGQLGALPFCGAHHGGHRCHVGEGDAAVQYLKEE